MYRLEYSALQYERVKLEVMKEVEQWTDPRNSLGAILAHTHIFETMVSYKIDLSVLKQSNRRTHCEVTN